MDNDEKWKFVEKAIKSIKDNGDIAYNFADILGISYDSPIIDSSGRLIDILIDSLEIIVGDKRKTIAWFVFDCECGEKPKNAIVNGVTREIATIEDLCWLIESSSKGKN